ncbi:MAG TPA: hypothetical protein VF043_11635 [Ktedonobacteraceae bacterium]
MTQQMPSPHSEEQPSQKKDSPKKLHKREQRILERLQEARAAQAKSLERFHRAEARLQKRIQRVQRVEGRLALIRQQMSGEPAKAPALPAEDAVEPVTAKEEEKPAEQAQAEQQSSATTAGTPESAPSSTVVDELPAPAVSEMPEELSTGDEFMEEILMVDAGEHVGLPPAYAGDTPEQPAEEAEAAAPQASSVKSSHHAQEARAAAEAAEENARRAAERSAEVTARIEQMGSGRHLMQELLETQAEADRVGAIAQEAERAAEEAEQEEQTSAAPDMETGNSGENEAPQTEDNGEEEKFYSLMQIELEASDDEIAETQEQEEITSPAQGSPITRDVENAELEEEEELVETLAAKSFAKIAAERAASAEAIAEASSVQTREAWRRVREAETALGQVRLAIRNGVLSDEEAENALQNAENELTRATAFLADAEATEEQALNNAMNAEAEAEVAEGMAYAAEHELEDQQHNLPPDISTSEDAPEEEDAEEDNESASTQKLPVVHPPESL